MERASGAAYTLLPCKDYLFMVSAGRKKKPSEGGANWVN
jgi:hypothetical protein